MSSNQVGLRVRFEVRWLKEYVLKETEGLGLSDRFSSIFHTELAKDMVVVRLHRADRDVKAISNVAVGEVCRDELEDFEFTDAEWFNQSG